MQTHPDHDAPRPFAEMLQSLEERAQGYDERGDAALTAGKPGEVPLAEARAGNVVVKRLPEDPDCIRISIGGPDIPDQFRYLVFRGNPKTVETQLREALAAVELLNRLNKLQP